MQESKIPSEFISFTHGDSTSTLKRAGSIMLMTKDMHIDTISRFDGTIDDYMKEIKDKHYYIEVQLWNNDCNI